MELLKLDERPAEYQYGDVTIFFRSVASNGDKFTLDTAGELTEDGQIKIEPFRFYKDIIRLFVTGWKGVTENGTEVPYSFETLVDRLPTQGDDLIMKLGLKIADVTGIYKMKGENAAEKKRLKRAVDWLETAGTFNCERRDCPQEVGRDCSLCDRPLLSRKTAAVIKLYRECREWKTLPAKGSLLDQPAVLMDLLDSVHGRVLFWQQQRAEEERSNLVKEQMKAKL